MKIFPPLLVFSMFLLLGTAAGDHNPNIGGVLDKAIRFQEAFDPMDGVLAYDKEDGYLSPSVTGSVNTAISGEYTLGYSVSDSVTNTKSFLRKITVLPAGNIAKCNATGRLNPYNIIELDVTYQNNLATNITFIKPVFDAVDDAVYEYKLIEYYWDGNSSAAGNPDIGEGHKIDPPSEGEWSAAQTKEFFKDLYLCKRPRIDRWLKMTVSSNSQTNEWVYGLEGDVGILFHSSWQDEDYYHLSEEVDDPQTVVDQYATYGQAATYWCNFPRHLQKRMGCHSEVTTIGSLVSSYDVCNEAELHGQLITIRAFMVGIDKTSSAAANWVNIREQWDHALSRAMNASYNRCYQIPISEPKFEANYLSLMGDLCRHFRSTYNTNRIYCIGGNKGLFKLLIDFYDASNPYLKVAWHKGHFNTMRERFPWTLTLGLPYYIQYSRINEVWSHDSAARKFREHREIHKLAQETHTEAAILDKLGMLARNPDGTWPEWTLMYQSMWFCYSGFDYLNNSLFFIDDWDGDGVSNVEERALNSNPFDPDTDGDMVFDGQEKKWGMDLLNPADASEDWDNDGMSNYEEILWTMTSPGAGTGLGPTLPITFTNELGNVVGMDINDPSDGQYDLDNDLLPVWFEVATEASPYHLFPPKNELKQFISDIDVAREYYGITKQLAYNYNLVGSDDVDGDGITNLQELVVGLNPHDAYDGSGDLDGDGISNSVEVALGTSLVGEDQTAVEFNTSIIKQDACVGISYSEKTLAWDVGAPDVGEFHAFQKQTGPAWLTIASNGRLIGSPAMDDAGENSWLIEVSDGKGITNTATLNIRVLATPMQYYAAWAGANSLTETNLLADPDEDQFVNMVEYALGRNPQGTEPSGDSWRKDLQMNRSGNTVELTFPKRNDAETRGLGYSIEVSSDLVGGVWSNKSFSMTEVERLSMEFDSITNRVSIPAEKQFFRLKIDIN